MTRFAFRFCFGMAACVISGMALDAGPSQAAAFSFSGSRLSLDNINLIPQVKASTLVSDAIANAGKGDVENNFDGALAFVADTDTRLEGLFEVDTMGAGDRYFGKSTVTSNAFAQFLVTPEQPFSLDFSAVSSLRNTVDTALERATAFSNISLSLLAPDHSILIFFNLDASVNTHPFDIGNNDALQVATNGQILGSNRQFSSGTNQEIGTVSFFGRFDRAVSQPTLLTLKLSTRNQSCTQAPHAENACVKVPESSFLWAFSLITALGLLVLPRRLRSGNAVV